MTDAAPTPPTPPPPTPPPPTPTTPEVATAATATTTTVDLPRWLWLWFPPMILVAHGVARAFGQQFYEDTIRSEFGLVENMTFGFLVLAVVIAVLLAFQARHVRQARGLFVAFCGVMALGCFYFAAEEVSWGFHWGFNPFGEEFAAELRKNNDQDETNFHNTTGFLGVLLDQLPRTMLTAAAFVGGILIPLWCRKKGPIRQFSWVWPTMVCLPTAVFAVFVSVPGKIVRKMGVDHAREWRMGETKEYFIALFLLLFLASLYYRVKKNALAGPPQAP